MIFSIKKELETRKMYLDGQKISSIYFGGGTPSILNVKHIYEIINIIDKLFFIKKNAEITIESNPEDLKKNKLSELNQIGINRLSIGVQSLNDDDLKLMNRSHNAKEAERSIELAKKVGFNNISVDLIYGLPNQSLTNWEDNLIKIFNLDIQHFSAYELTIEKNTALELLIKNKKLVILDENITITHFKTLIDMAKQNNFIHYEISNFGKKDFFSHHNSSYWKNKCYLGIGPSAHSYNKISRQWNINSNKQYIQKIENGKQYYEVEILSNNQKYNEYVFTNLRTLWGVDSNDILTYFGEKTEKHFLKQINKWQEDKVVKNNSIYILTNEGKLYADKITSDLFIVD